MRKYISIVLIYFAMSFVNYNYASHLRAGEITADRVGCSNTFKIKVTVYVNTLSLVMFGGSGDILFFGDGTSITVPEAPSSPLTSAGPNVGVAIFETTHTYGSDGIYKISYLENARNEGVLNFSNSSITAFSISTTLNTTSEFNCNKLPILLVPPVDRVCSGVTFFHNPGAYDPDGDSLSYAITVPQGGNGLVQNYLNPDDPVFYLDYNHGNEVGNGKPSFIIDPVNGTLTWDAPGSSGEYGIAIIIFEWRKDSNGSYVILSETIRDMQILVEDCPNKRPDIIIPMDICIEAGQTLNVKVFGSDPENDDVKIESFSEVYVQNSTATFKPSPPDFVPSVPPAEAVFMWITDCINARERPYQVVFKITDNPANGPGLVTIKVLSIKLTAPPIEGLAVSLDLVNRRATLNWNNYECQNAEKIQILRRVDSFNMNNDPCLAANSNFNGYETIGEMPVGTTSFTDTNSGKKLSAGAKYCYRVEVIFKNPYQLTRLSDEVCLDPIVVDAPVITNVTVEKTHYKDGTIQLNWRSPFEINKTQFPEPYFYEVYRGDGFESETDLIKVSNRISDTTFVDTGINTDDSIFNYRVVVYSIPQNENLYYPIDTSSVASSIRLEVTPGNGSISLNWNAKVPWSNHNQRSPWHLIYRSTGIDNDLVLIDSVNVTVDGFSFVDIGDFLGAPIQSEEIYCYKVMTRGTYGNHEIDESETGYLGVKPLENFSQISCSYPENSLLPCKPKVIVQQTDCDAFLSNTNCDFNDFQNSISWEPNFEKGCRKDIVAYNIYASSEENGDFLLIDSARRDNFLVERSLSSYARCYRVESIDRLGRISEASDISCNDNCPFIEFPNVFTPNSDGCNDQFGPYGRNVAGEESDCQMLALQKCPRFVNGVKFSVYNRLGQKVYGFESSDDESKYISWDGRDTKGNELPSAIYYYSAEVSFLTALKGNRNKFMKGWVHLLR